MLISALIYATLNNAYSQTDKHYCTEYKTNEHGVERCTSWLIYTKEPSRKFHRLSEWLDARKVESLAK
jgi:hypothetical protein